MINDLLEDFYPEMLLDDTSVKFNRPASGIFGDYKMAPHSFQMNHMVVHGVLVIHTMTLVYTI